MRHVALRDRIDEFSASPIPRIINIILNWLGEPKERLHVEKMAG
jgi:hypothetical protein